MDEMEREALRRAERMRSAFQKPERVHNTPKKQEVKPEKEETPLAPPPKKEGEEKTLDFLLKDKDTTLILLLIIFLYDENTDPMLIMALVYLMI